MSKRLLLADDSITIQKVIQITFAHEDYQLIITDNGDTALAKAREQAPDLVLADVYMPGKNGYELCAAIKQTPGLEQVPVLLLAGSFEPFDEGKARAAGADAWIEKPFESQALIDKVATLLAAPIPAAVPPPAPAPERVEPVVPMADPFADINFEVPPPTAPPVAPPPDDWSDLNDLAPQAVAPPAAAPAPEPAAAMDFEFAEDVFAAPVAAPAAPASDFDMFDDAEEIMALGDDDILAAEDLEPPGAVPTLTPWSRDEAPAEEPFEPFDTSDELLAEPSPEPAPTPAVAREIPVAPAAVPAVAEVPAVPDVAAAAAPAVAGEQRVTTLSETEIEQIVERTVGKLVEKLAGTVLERVAWEVVPDLAEALIKEEIRKIRDAAA